MTPAAVSPVPSLQICDLVVEYPGRWRQRTVRAVDGVTLTIPHGQTVALVGESGSGKTSVGNAVLGVVAVTAGTILLDGRPAQRLTTRARRVLGRELQAVFQDPHSSLSPTRTIGQSLAEPLQAAGIRLTATDAADRAAAVLRQVGLPPDAVRRYPGEFSGGQRQRIAIARALIASPRLVICDEPTSALDVSVRGQILNLLMELQSEYGLSYLFISHDVAAVRHVAGQVVVLYQGRVMESGPAADVLSRPSHPYTQALLEAVPVVDPDLQERRRRQRQTQPGTSNPATQRPTIASCPFAPRCPHGRLVCRERRPELAPRPAGTGLVACHRVGELPAYSLESRTTMCSDETRVALANPDRDERLLWSQYPPSDPL